MALLKRWLLAGMIAAVVLATVVVAADDEDDDDVVGQATGGKVIEDIPEGIDAEDAAGDIADNAEEDDKASTNAYGIVADHYFVNYRDLKLPAGERLEVLIPITSLPQNPTYEIAYVMGNIALLDHSRSIQNFSAQVYQRNIEGGETATVKYSVTPDAQLDPMDYAFTIVAYLRNVNDNTTIMAPAYNGTMLVVDPLGFDFKGLFSIVAFFGAIGGAGYYFLQVRQASRPAPRRAAARVETGTKDTAYDPEFVDKSHLQYVERSGRNRSASK